jgi:hypothetical protein
MGSECREEIHLILRADLVISDVEHQLLRIGGASEKAIVGGSGEDDLWGGERESDMLGGNRGQGGRGMPSLFEDFGGPFKFKMKTLES